MAEHAARRQHGELGVRRGARCRAENGDVIAFGRVHQLIVKLRLARGAVAAHLRQLVSVEQAWIAVFAHSARIGIDDVLEVRRAVAKFEQLVDLLFVLGEDDLGFAVSQQIQHFLGQRLAVHAERHAADGVGGDFGCDPVRPVVTDNADHVAALDAELDHAQREITHAVLIVVPGEDAPETEVLFAQRNLFAVLRRIEPQHLGVGVGLCDAACIVHHAVASATGLVSSSASSTSSSSPR